MMPALLVSRQQPSALPMAQTTLSSHDGNQTCACSNGMPCPMAARKRCTGCLKGRCFGRGTEIGIASGCIPASAEREPIPNRCYRTSCPLRLSARCDARGRASHPPSGPGFARRLSSSEAVYESSYRHGRYPRRDPPPSASAQT